MNAVWKLPELAEVIIEHLPKDDLKSVLLCSRRDFSLALPRLWINVSTPQLHALIGCLAPDQLSDDHKRLLMFTANTRHLTLTANLSEKNSDQSFIESLNNILQQYVPDSLFPRLRTLEIDLWSSSRLWTTARLVTSALEGLNLHFCDTTDCFDDPREWMIYLLDLNAALRRGVNLMDINVDGKTDLCMCVPGSDRWLLPNLVLCPDKVETLRLQSFSYSPEMLHFLVALPRLQVLDIGEVWQWDWEDVGREYLEQLSDFPSLKTFICRRCTSSRTFIALLGKARGLHQVSLGIGDSQLVNAEAIFRGVSLSQDTLMRLDIRAGSQYFSRTHFAPLYDCHHVKEAILKTYKHGEEVVSSFFHDTARSWPEVHSFSMKRITSTHPGTSQEAHVQPLYTLDVLQCFARHCPDIKFVEIDGIQASDDLTPPQISVFPPIDRAIHLKVLRGPSIESANPEDVAQYLANVFPERQIRLADGTPFSALVQNRLDTRTSPSKRADMMITPREMVRKVPSERRVLFVYSK